MDVDRKKAGLQGKKIEFDDLADIKEEPEDIEEETETPLGDDDIEMEDME